MMNRSTYNHSNNTKELSTETPKTQHAPISYKVNKTLPKTHNTSPLDMIMGNRNQKNIRKKINKEPPHKTINPITKNNLKKNPLNSTNT
jgi:hypothetical protein